MKKLVATAPRVAALVEYEDRAILANEVKIRVRFGAPKHGTEVVDFRAASPFIDEDFNGEWQMFTPRPADAPRGIEFGKFQLGNMVVGDIIDVRQRRYRLRGGRQRMRLRPALRDGHH